MAELIQITYQNVGGEPNNIGVPEMTLRKFVSNIMPPKEGDDIDYLVNGRDADLDQVLSDGDNLIAVTRKHKSGE